MKTRAMSLIEKLEAEIERLQAENVRLRRLLAEIAERCRGEPDNIRSIYGLISIRNGAARTAEETKQILNSWIPNGEKKIPE